ncbi:hypothetical protein E2C01_024263 [Portunus trituberculatus]|uniref:Uncharacterized protein n=1 Tax=Portunus trituberculatus TaxID=210409 RepID=A0A5B7EA69_PORTR|nr:hypothetical protein [Portunus trituberculatus]
MEEPHSSICILFDGKTEEGPFGWPLRVLASPLPPRLTPVFVSSGYLLQQPHRAKPASRSGDADTPPLCAAGALSVPRRDEMMRYSYARKKDQGRKQGGRGRGRQVEREGTDCSLSHLPPDHLVRHFSIPGLVLTPRSVSQTHTSNCHRNNTPEKPPFS